VSAGGDERPSHATRHPVIAGVLVPRGVRAGTDGGRTRAAEGHGRRLIFRTRHRTDPISGSANNGDAPDPHRSRSRQSSPSPAVPAPAGGSNNPRPATSFGDCASTATRSCASSPTCAFPQAKRDLRMPKLKQKVSDCFRSDTGGDAFAITRSCLSTRRKQSDDIFSSLVLTLQGQPPMSQLE